MDKEANLKKYSQTTFKTSQEVNNVLFPKNVQELVNIVKEANTNKASIHVTSKGMNFGYGNTVPIKDNSTLIDLSLMDKIEKFDPKHGTVTVQPGVTYQDLYCFLKEQGNDWIISGTGAPINGSLIGNLAERGIGKGLTANRSDYVCNIELVLPTGEIIHTNMGKYDNCTVKDLTRSGPGPQLDGLFIQSSLAIITKATFWLTRRPKYFGSFIFSMEDNEQMANTMNALRELKQKDIIRSNFALFNDYRILGLKSTFPWDKCEPNSALPRDIAQKELKKLLNHRALWVGEGALFCHSKKQLKAEMSLIKKTIRPHCKHQLFFTKINSALIKFLAKLIRKPDWVELVDNIFDNSSYLGVPIPFTLNSCYWRKKTRPKEIAPIEDGCGLIWLGPMIPFDGTEIKKLVNLVEEIIFRYGFEPALTLQALTARQVDMIISIGYDRQEPGQDELAMQCHDELMSVLTNKGYYPYRLGVQSMGKIPSSPEVSINMKLKQVLDPNRVLAEGRYPD